jgi:hypothetical protein
VLHGKQQPPELYRVAYRPAHTLHARIIPTVLTPEQAERLVESLNAVGAKCWLSVVKPEKALKAHA